MNITGKTKLLCLIGNPIEHSFSPLMHNSAIVHLGLDFVYVAFHVKKEKIKEAVLGMEALGIVGANVTIPYKVEIMEYLDRVDEEASTIGAVNTIVYQEGVRIGYNTDGSGFINSLKERNVFLSGKRVSIFGAGGAARAVAHACAREGVASIAIINRNVDKAKDLGDHLRELFPRIEVIISPLAEGAIKDIVSDSYILVNATPVGMQPDDPSIIPPELISSSHVVYDLIYNPVRTSLLGAAQERGAEIINGVDMLVHQGAKSFVMWTGIVPPVRIMKDAILSQIQS